MMRFHSKYSIAGGVVALLGAYPLTAYLMVWWPEEFLTESFAYVVRTPIVDGLATQETYSCQVVKFRARDGLHLAAHRFASDSRDTFVFIHGTGGCSRHLNRSSGRLRDAAGMEVIAMELRGHGESNGRPGDIDYIGQYEDDLADVVADLRRKKQGGRIILAGHSMGAGIVQRYGMRRDVPKVDAVVLFSPVNPVKAGEKTQCRPSPDEPVVRIHVPRVVGLAMLNAIGLNGCNDEFVAFVQNADPTDRPIAYTYNAVSSMAQAQSATEAVSLDCPTLVVLGADGRDLAMAAAAERPATRTPSLKDVVYFSDAPHHVQNDPRAIRGVARWLRSL